MLGLCLALAICLYRTVPSRHPLDLLTDDLLIEDAELHGITPPDTNHNGKSEPKTSPEEWIKHHSSLHHNNVNTPAGWKHPIQQPHRPRAALISLVRSSELSGILQSMRQLEYHFNRHHNYPWIFFSEKPFTAKFINETRRITSAHTQYELIPRTHWSVPDWVDEDRFMQSLDYLGALGVGKGHMVSYRHMCRWNSGFFYKHPALREYDYYWRIEPDVHFFCDIPYNPFELFEQFGFVYGFNMAILEDARSFPSLWEVTRRFVGEHPELVHGEADVTWLLDSAAGGGYNGCQFFSNFEIGDLNFFRGNDSRSGRWSKRRANDEYFSYLDKLGGFFYERFGDAPIHTLSVSLFAPRDKVWFFRDIGYQHDIARHCPPESEQRCTCNPTKLDENFYKLVPMESPQRKPEDTCLRMWLEGSGDGKGGWLAKKEGWDAEMERMVGGDGYGGYVRDG